MLTQQQILKILAIIKTAAASENVYLFGSYAKGTASPKSDLDVLVVKDKIEDKYEELYQIKQQIISKDYSVDLLLYSKEEFEKKKQEGWSILDEIEIS